MIEIPIIGRVNSCYNEKWGTPRQGKYGLSSLATIELNTNIVCRDKLKDLEEHSHTILIFIFNLNKIKNSQKKNFLYINNTNAYFVHQNAKVTPPKIDSGEKRGCLATRSPHRPVPIGLTICNIVNIDLFGMKIQVGGVDIIDGTPIVEIFPYSLNYSISRNVIHTPNWVKPEKNSGIINLCIYFSFASFLDILGISKLKKIETNIQFFDDGDSYRNFNKLRNFIVEILKIDPRSRYSKKKTKLTLFGIKLFNSFQLIYHHHKMCIKVIRFLHTSNLLVEGLNPRTINWYNRLKNFISLDM
ncbi:hypothetical protein CPHLJ_5g1700 [Cryptosporidium parvum]|uniref:TsaA-like domain-containing protein n=2 Tax=Cryptosporidium parvum TaxID=5807 RepID=A0A7S7LG69_CRYPV|nr:TsaA-like domain containing protein [Cryptosporidium parvum]WKS77823.1 hypothetical protein CPCDC_5g1700 [Cryptosporidium sp. 43IA8]WRK32314.1 TsaA-like domain containing protein [Cryptosporidium parvum]|eukprot:QOY41602.1 hypothetical protein CPATCC_002174 [Cryptosporidium parvum]